ncbi:MAG: hypothetical protein K2O45_04535 [Oscillospiraceae bacterium]|nr:hypothetical protein [Oscillospiraceae bacterium]
MNTTSRKKRVQLVISDTIYSRLKNLSEASGRTVPGYLRWRVHNHLEKLDTESNYTLK